MNSSEFWILGITFRVFKYIYIHMFVSGIHVARVGDKYFIFDWFRFSREGKEWVVLYDELGRDSICCRLACVLWVLLKFCFVRFKQAIFVHKSKSSKKSFIHDIRDLFGPKYSLEPICHMSRPTSSHLSLAWIWTHDLRTLNTLINCKDFLIFDSSWEYQWSPAAYSRI